MTLHPRARPDDHQLLLLKAALAEGDAVVDAWQAWRDAVGGVELHDSASYRILPLVYRKLVVHDPADPDLPRLKGVYRHTWAANQQALHRLAEVVSRLDGAGVQTMLLKGAALVERYYRNIGARTMTDFDVLVQRRQRGRACRLLAEAGWTARAQRTATAHSAVFVRGKNTLDLHWYSLYESSDDRDFWERAVPLGIRGASTRALCDADQLVHVIVDGTGRWPDPVAWVADAATVVAEGNVDWARVSETATRLAAVQRTEAALRFLADELGATVDTTSLAAAPRARRGRILDRALVRPRRGYGQLYRWDRWRRTTFSRPRRPYIRGARRG